MFSELVFDSCGFLFYLFIFCIYLQISARVLLFGETIEEAIRKKRFHHHFSPNVLKYEFGFPQVCNLTWGENNYQTYVR